MRIHLLITEKISVQYTVAGVLHNDTSRDIKEKEQLPWHINCNLVRKWIYHLLWTNIDRGATLKRNQRTYFLMPNKYKLLT